MRLKPIVVCGVAVLAAVLLPAAVAGAPPPPVLVAKMNGNDEIHGPTDPDARGRAVFNVRRKRQRICFYVEFRKFGVPDEDPEPLPNAGHIHRGHDGEVGPIVLTLFDTPTASPAEGCLRKVNLDLLNEMVRRPARFYVNLHTAEYPEGVIRGQLSRK